MGERIGANFVENSKICIMLANRPRPRGSLEETNMAEVLKQLAAFAPFGIGFLVVAALVVLYVVPQVRHGFARSRS